MCTRPGKLVGWRDIIYNTEESGQGAWIREASGGSVTQPLNAFRFRSSQTSSSNLSRPSRAAGAEFTGERRGLHEVTSLHLPETRILVVDDDPGIRDIVSEYLSEHGYKVEVAADGRSMGAITLQRPPDLIVLDVMLPGENGLEICKRVSGPGRPSIIMLSAMGEDADRVVGLELGADDYLAKPCNPRELLARVRAVLRRRQEHSGSNSPQKLTCAFAGWRLDLTRRELRAPCGRLVSLTPGEYQLLTAMVERPQRVLTRDQLLEYARGPDFEAFDRTVDVQVSRLRRKLQGDGAESSDPGELIRTIRHGGYLFDARVSWAQ